MDPGGGGVGGLKRHGFSSENKIKRKPRPGCACVANSLLVAGTVVSSTLSFNFKHIFKRYVSQPFTISSILDVYVNFCHLKLLKR